MVWIFPLQLRIISLVSCKLIIHSTWKYLFMTLDQFEKETHYNHMLKGLCWKYHFYHNAAKPSSILQSIRCRSSGATWSSNWGPLWSTNNKFAARATNHRRKIVWYTLHQWQLRWRIFNCNMRWHSPNYSRHWSNGYHHATVDLSLLEFLDGRRGQDILDCLDHFLVATDSMKNQRTSSKWKTNFVFVTTFDLGEM